MKSTERKAIANPQVDTPAFWATGSLPTELRKESVSRRKRCEGRNRPKQLGPQNWPGSELHKGRRNGNQSHPPRVRRMTLSRTRLPGLEITPRRLSAGPGTSTLRPLRPPSPLENQPNGWVWGTPQAVGYWRLHRKRCLHGIAKDTSTRRPFNHGWRPRRGRLEREPSASVTRLPPLHQTEARRL